MEEGFDLGFVTVMRKTEKAIQVYSGDYGPVWIPFSQIHDDSDIFDNADDGDKGDMVVTQWFAEQKGW